MEFLIALILFAALLGFICLVDINKCRVTIQFCNRWKYGYSPDRLRVLYEKTVESAYGARHEFGFRRTIAGETKYRKGQVKAVRIGLQPIEQFRHYVALYDQDLSLQAATLWCAMNAKYHMY